MYKNVEDAIKIESNPDLELYFQWARAHEIRWDKIEYPVLFPPGYIGSRAIASIEPEESIITVPNNMLITTKIAFLSEIKHIYEENPDLFSKINPRYEELILITFLIWEKCKGSNSVWYEFIISQPVQVEILQDWSIEEIQQLQDEDLEYESQSQLSAEIKLYSDWKQAIEKYPQYFQPNMLDYAEFNWAYKLIGTRAFVKFVPHWTLAPIAELLNHHNTSTFYCYNFPNEISESLSRYNYFEEDEDNDEDFAEKIPITTINCKQLLSINKDGNENIDESLRIKYEKLIKEAEKIDDNENDGKMRKERYQQPNILLIENDEKQLKIVAGLNDRYEAGSEVYMSYGRDSNKRLLSVYGFSLKDNKYNYARIKVNLTDLSSNLNQIQYMINSSLDGIYAFKIRERHLCLDLLRVIRALKWSNKFPEAAFFLPASIDLEIQTFEYAKNILNRWISRYPTTYERDLELLQENPPLKLYFALVYRSEVKKILLKQMQLIDIIMRLLMKLKIGAEIEQALNEELENSEDGLGNKRVIEVYLDMLK
ncbi:unnamed protein product [Blepharisma stoltei]|uniref:Rubisco LSMT substrate-binding domain-containing protein n=1 Tax=Blepharisma stoltei TaxID=1481888 RepID=A0AAU9IZ69_9CILI|nr:unnamed protein product [Blepharisma stoltei]